MSVKNRSKKDRSETCRTINGVTRQRIVSEIYAEGPMRSQREIARNVWMPEGHMGMYGIDATNMSAVISSYMKRSISS